MKAKKRKAFTLTELLVVVIVLGILAAVAIPKFKRVVESRKTTEAENMLSAIRTEQEMRCVMGKGYLNEENKNKLDVLAKVSPSKNYTYTLTQTGAQATASNYTLKMLSYKSGVMCCSGSGCEQLNKNYPTCNDSIEIIDECVGNDSGGETPTCDIRDQQDCEEGQSGIHGTWNSSTCTCTCPAGSTLSAGICEQACNFSEQQNCEQGQLGIAGVWNSSTCSCTCPTGYEFDHHTGCEHITCPSGAQQDCQQGSQTTQSWGSSVAGTWNENTCTCTCPAGSELVDGGCSKICNNNLKNACLTSDEEVTAGTWNASTCTCSCPSGSTLDSGYCVLDACAGYESQKSVCQGGSFPGTWDDEICRCSCPGSTSWSSTQGCRCGSGAQDRCEGEPQDNRFVAGTWNASTCNCQCPSGTSLDPHEGNCLVDGSDPDYAWVYTSRSTNFCSHGPHDTCSYRTCNASIVGQTCIKEKDTGNTADCPQGETYIERITYTCR